MHTNRFSPPASSDSEENGDSPEVSLTIRAVDGRQAYLQVSHSIQISALCELVALEFNESVERVRLIYRGKGLKPEDRLAQYIPRSAADEPHCLHVVFRVPPAESGQHSVVDESGRSSSNDAPASEERGRNAALFSHALPTGLLMDTFRLGPTAQFSVTAAGDNAGNGQGSLLTSPSFLQSLMSSLASAAVNGSTGNSNATRTNGATATAGASNDERAEERRSASRVPPQETTARQQPAAAGRSAQQDTSSSLPRSFAVQQTTFPDFPSSSSMPLHHEATTTEPPTTGTARMSDGSTTRPQQVRVTVGSLPVTLGATGLSQIFHSVLGQLANTGNNDTTQPSAASRSRPSPGRRRISTAFSDFSLRNAHLTSNTAPPAEEASSRVPRDTSAFRRTGDAQHPVTPGLSSFLRRTVNVLAESRRGVTQASETILETLEEALTQSSAEGSNRLIHAGATSAAPRQSVGALNGSQTRQQQQQPESVWISNESISEELPWSTLQHLAQILRRATGWQLPELTPNAERSSPLDSSPPLARFLLSFQQLTSMSVALLTQVEAWQRGSGRLGITDIGHCVQVFALSSSIQASLAALFSWLFFHLAHHVDSSTLFDRMQWCPSTSADQPIISRHRAFTTVRHTEEDDDAFVDAHESPTVEPLPPPTTTIPPEGPAEPEVADANSSSSSSSSLSDDAKALSSSSSRKRANEEDQFSEVSSCSAVSVTPDIPIDDASAVKKQRTTDSPLHTKKKNSDTSGPQSSNALTDHGVLADNTSRSSNGFSQSVAHVASSTVNPHLPSFFPMSQLQQAAAAPPQRSNNTAATTTTVVSRLPITVRERYERWTSDPGQFSRAVIGQARRMRPLSDAYLSGTPGSNVSQEQSDVQAVAPLFGIRWRQAASRVNVPQESIESVSHNLDRTYVLLLLKELVDQARANPDFQEEPQRYKYIREAMRRLRDEEHNTAKD